MDKKSYLDVLRKQHYAIFGSHQHSAAKLCTWTKKSLRGEGVCYKQLFYGVNSHRCLQMTPNIYCNQRCVFCWRSWEYAPTVFQPDVWDEPEEIVEESIKAQRVLLSGYGGLPGLDKKRYEEALNPNQVAISLTGEPTIYPKIWDLVHEYKKSGFTTFIVSNAMLPERFENMTEKPTQLYFSLDAPDEATHKKVNVPMLSDSWQRLNRSLEIMSTLNDVRRVLRITVVKGFNDKDPEGYARLIEKSGADFLEVKAYMFVGGSRNRLSITNMPSHDYVKEFASRINEFLGWKFGGEQPPSRVVVYARGSKPMKIGKV